MTIALLHRQSKLAFPNRLPGFDPTHPASKAIANGNGVSFIANGANAVSLISGKPFTVNGTVTSTIDAAMGPCANMANGVNYLSLSGQSTSTPPGVTFAVIYKSTIVPGTGGLITNGSSATVFIISSGLLQIYAPNFISSGFAPAENVPYFMAGSYNNAVANFVVVNLSNGSTFSAAVGSANTLTAPNGTLVTTNAYSLGQNPSGLMAAGMYAPHALTLPELLQWAADPWSFWYPPGQIDTLDWIGNVIAAGTPGTWIPMGFAMPPGVVRRNTVIMGM